MSFYYLGIDGGGTATKCLLADPQGEVIARSEAGPSNYLAVGRVAAREAVSKAVGQALMAASAEVGDVKVAALGMAGGDRATDQLVLREICREIGLTGELILDNDAMIALMAGTHGQPGVVVIAGTGSIGFGFNQAGERSRVDGWGYLLGDSGSGYDIARQALIACLRQYDGRGESTALHDLFVRHLGIESVPDIIGEVYGGRLTRAAIASLAPLVFQAAAQGDKVAGDIVKDAGWELGLTAATVVRRLNMESHPVEVVLSGGVFRAGELILKPFHERLRDTAPHARTSLLDLEPAVGALYMAFKKDGLLDEKVVHHVRASYYRLKKSLQIS